MVVFAANIGEAQLLIPPHALWPNNPSYGVLFSNTLIKKSPKIITTFLEHHKQAEELLRDNPQEAAQRIAQTFKIVDAEYVMQILAISPKYCIVLDDRFVDATMGLQDQMVNLGYLAHPHTVDEIFDFRFVKKVHPEPAHF